LQPPQPTLFDQEVVGPTQKIAPLATVVDELSVHQPLRAELSEGRLALPIHQILLRSPPSHATRLIQHA